MRNADVGIVFLHPVTHLLGMHGAAAGVNIRAIGSVAVNNDIGAELAQGAGRGLVGGTVPTIDDDGYTLERLAARKRAFSIFDIPAEASSMRTALPMASAVGRTSSISPLNTRFSICSSMGSASL